MVRHRPRRYRSNPTAREIGALIITTAITAGVATIITWWVTKELESKKQTQQQQPPQLPPAPAPNYGGNNPGEGYWA
jgi:hypothetical protein